MVQTTSKEMARVNQSTGELVETGSHLTLRLDPMEIEIAQHNKLIAEKLVASVLDEGVDYGQIPGLEGKCLFDPGAAAIMNAFNVYAQHEVIYHEEKEGIISWVIQTKLIHRESQNVVSTGVGACSTKEPKYKYRWLWKSELPPDLTEEELKKLKKRKRGDDYQYRVVNPEYGELVNTIMSMAAKRSEVDAVKGLPGAGSALRKLLDPKVKKQQQQQQEGPDWDKFWGWAGSAGVADRVHDMLGVKSMKDWLAQGFTLETAKQTLIEKMKVQTQSSGVVPPFEEVSPFDEEPPTADINTLRQEICELLKKGPNPSDAKIEAWWDKKGWGYNLTTAVFASDSPFSDVVKLEHLAEFKKNLEIFQKNAAAKAKR